MLGSSACLLERFAEEPPWNVVEQEWKFISRLGDHEHVRRCRIPLSVGVP